MNQIKRQLSITEFSDDSRKKLQKIFVKPKKSINCLENLSNEIFYEIFEYLNSCDIFRIFSNLNSRFKYLLINLSIPLKFDFLYETSHLLLSYYEKIIVINKHRIISLHPSIILRCNLFYNDLLFIHLESLTLSINNLRELKLLSNLFSLPCLCSLTIYLHDSMDYINDVYKKIFSLSMLKYAKLSFETSSRSGLLSIATYDKYTLIESLIIDHNCTLDRLFTILSYTPRLVRLTCKKLSESQFFNTKISFNKPKLTHLTIGECCLNFEDFEIFIKEISSQLKVLRISTLNDVIYLNANRWEQLISQYIFHLSIFEFKYTEFIHKKFRITSNHKEIYRFTSLFWIERRWFLEYRVGARGRNGGIISYIIRPYRYSEKDPLVNKFVKQDESSDSSIALASSVQLTIIHLAFLKWTRSFINCIRPVLSLLKITRLVFRNHGILIRTLIELIRMLSNLDSLVISSFASLDQHSLSVPQMKNAGSKVKENKITKVHIERINVLEEIQFLIHLCPRMHYLEMDNIDDIHVKALLRLILIQYRKTISDHFSLHLRNFQLDNETIQQLQNIINTEKLHDNCSFTQAFNNIHVQYKKY